MILCSGIKPKLWQLMICNWPLCLWGSKEQYTLNLPTIIPNKGDFKIEKQLPRRNMKYVKCLL